MFLPCDNILCVEFSRRSPNYLPFRLYHGIIYKRGDFLLEQFWEMLVDFKIAEYYYQAYALYASRRKMCLSIVYALSSVGFVVGWFYTGSCHLLWGALIVLAQVLSVLQPFMPYDKQLRAACYIHQDIVPLNNRIGLTWLSINDNTSEKRISNWVQEFQDEHQRIETRFATPNTFPQNRRLHKKAEENTLIYLERYNSHG